MALINVERNYKKTRTFIDEVFKTKISETVTLSLKDGTLDVQLHMLLLPCDFLETLLSDIDSESAKVIIMPDIEKEDMMKVLELITTGDTPYKEARGLEIIDLLYFVLQFDTKEFSFDQHRSWPKLDNMYRGVERKKEKKKIPYTPYNIHENKRQVFTTDELTCHYCLKYFERKDHLKEHLKVCSKAHSKESIQAQLQSLKCFSCDVCNKTLRTKESLRQHKLTHSENFDFSCPSCEKSYSSLQALFNHLKAEGHKYPDSEKYKMLRSQNIPENFRPCEVCGRWVGRMEHHMKTHHSEESRLFECEYCDYNTNRKDNFNRHQDDMHKVIARNFKCIDQSFKGRKPEWHCFDCKITLNSELEIENHIKAKHCDELKCNMCEKEFKKHQHLVQHIRYIHENPQRHNCTKCGKSYAHKGSLTKHLKKCKK